MAERVGLEPTVRLPVLNAVGNCSIPRRTVILCHALTEKQRDVTVFTDNGFHNIGIGILRHHVGPLAQQAERDLAQGHLESIDAAAITSDMSVLGRFLITKKHQWQRRAAFRRASPQRWRVHRAGSSAAHHCSLSFFMPATRHRIASI